MQSALQHVKAARDHFKSLATVFFCAIERLSPCTSRMVSPRPSRISRSLDPASVTTFVPAALLLCFFFHRFPSVILTTAKQQTLLKECNVTIIPTNGRTKSRNFTKSFVLLGRATPLRKPLDASAKCLRKRLARMGKAMPRSCHSGSHRETLISRVSSFWGEGCPERQSLARGFWRSFFCCEFVVEIRRRRKPNLQICDYISHLGFKLWKW